MALNNGLMNLHDVVLIFGKCMENSYNNYMKKEFFVIDNGNNNNNNNNSALFGNKNWYLLLRR